MRICMKEPVDQKLIAIESNQILHHLLRVYIVAQDFTHFGNPEALEEFHDENTGRSDFAVNGRDDDEIAVSEKLSETLDIIRLVMKIHFLGDDTREFFDDRARRPDDVVIDELLQDEYEVLNDSNIDCDEFFHSRTKHLDDDILATVSSPVHLSERRCGERFGFKGLEDFV